VRLVLSLAVVAVVAAATALSSTSSPSSSSSSGASKASRPVSDACDRRADVVDVRDAEGGARAALRKRLDDDVAAAGSPRQRACAAAVAAEAAALDGDKARTLALLDAAVADLPVLVDDARPRRALLLAELGRVDDARKELALVDARAVAWRARIELAIADASRDRAAARALLQRQASRDDDATARLCFDFSDDDACIDALVRHPRSNASARLEKLADDGVERGVVRLGSWPAARIAARVRALTQAARPHRAVVEGRRWVTAHEGLAPKSRAPDGAVRAALAEALLRTGDVDGAVDITRLARVTPDGRGDVEATRAQSKALTRAGHVDDAVAALQRLSHDAAARGDRDVAAEAAFFAAFSFVEVDDVDRALGALAAAASTTAGSPWETQRAWYQALLLLTAKNDARAALPVLDVLAAGKDREVRKFRYWQARALRALDRRADADVVLRALVVDDALDWYGQLARRDLALPPLSGAAVAPDALAALAAREASDDDAATTRLLWNLGFDDEARARCRARAQRGSGRPSLVDVGVCHQVEDPTSGWRRGALFSPRPDGDALSSTPAWRVSYAAPWTKAVDDVAAAAAVPRSFVWAIMRTESGFDPSAVSVAGARGALQLLPSVARGIAMHDGLSPSLADRLDDPRVAVALGGRLLGLLSHEHGSLLVAAAAYNGAPENAAAWAKRFGTLPADVFVERIPFKESRDYVKRVLAVEAVYRALDGASDGVRLALPDTIAPAPSPTLFPYVE
jgi:soluble lytic murein transglycosylase-like protein